MYYLIRWFVCFLSVFDSLISFLTFGFITPGMARHIFFLHFTKQLNKPDKDRKFLNVPKEKWEPGFYYSYNSIFAIWEDEPYYVQYLNTSISVYLADDDKRVIGVIISGIEQAIKEAEK